MAKKFGKVLAASSILAGACMGVFMYLKKEGIIELDDSFPAKKLADKVSADAADRLGLDRTYVHLSEVDKDDIAVPKPVKTEPVKAAPAPEPIKTEPVKAAPAPEPVKSEPVKAAPAPEPVKTEPVKSEPAAAASPAEAAPADAEEKKTEPVEEAKPERSEPNAVSPQNETNDSITGDGAVDDEPASAKADEPVPAPKPEPAYRKAANDPDAPTEPLDDEPDFEPGIVAPTIDLSQTRAVGTVASEEFFNDENQT